ncbi:MAG: agmatinase [Defluviitaleaceae bacterium]|nr:agmatinase [Defluviitaleaceae bacterium]
MQSQKNVFMGCECDYLQAKVVMFGAPFDGTTSFRPGARFAGAAIRADSFGVESYSPYQDRDLGDICAIDLGDIELPFGNPTKILDLIERQTAEILQDGKIPFMIGGEHLCTLGAVRAAVKKYPNLQIIHLDAHADLRDEYLGEKLSHATVMRRCWEVLDNQTSQPEIFKKSTQNKSPKIHQFGIRSGDRTEFDFAEKNTNMHKYFLDDFGQLNKFKKTAKSQKAAKSAKNFRQIKNNPIYLSLDLDVLDPSVFPGTGTPEPGGVTFADLHKFVLNLKNFDIIGCDVCELSPPYDPSGISTAAACKIIRELLLIIA